MWSCAVGRAGIYNKRNEFAMLVNSKFKTNFFINFSIDELVFKWYIHHNSRVWATNIIAADGVQSGR